MPHAWPECQVLDCNEEVNEATVQYVGVVLDLQKPRVSCQTYLSEGNEEGALSDLQIGRGHRYPDNLLTSTRI